MFGAIAGKLLRLDGWSDLKYKAGYHLGRIRRRHLTPRGRYHYLHYRRRRLAWRHKQPLDYPNIIHFELTSRCNARCAMCLTTTSPAPNRHVLRAGAGGDPGLAAGGIDRASLFSFGESLLNKHLPEVVALVKQRQPRCFAYITTNALLWAT